MQVSYFEYVHTRINAYIRISKQSEKICITTGFEFRTRNLVHTFSRHHHCTMSVNTSVLVTVLPFALTGTIYISVCSLLSRVTWLLVSDVRRGIRGAARPGHDVAGPGLHLKVLVLAAASRCQ